MKRSVYKSWILICLTVGLASAPALGVQAQADELAQLALNIEKLAQFKLILADLKKGYQILSGGYNTVKTLSKGNYELHQVFLDGLLSVSPSIASYWKVGEIIKFQAGLLGEYKKASERFRASGRFSAQELKHISSVYDQLIRSSLNDLDDLAAVIAPGKLRMSDDERMSIIDRVHRDVNLKRSFLHRFLNNASILSLQRERDQQDIMKVRQFYPGR